MNTRTEETPQIERLKNVRNQILASYWRQAETWAADPLNENKRQCLENVMNALEEVTRNYFKAEREAL